jgi:hypothetical protein
MTTRADPGRYPALRRVCRAVLLGEAVAAGGVAIRSAAAGDSSWRWFLAAEMVVLGLALWGLGRRWPAGTWTPPMLALVQLGIGISVPTMAFGWSPMSPGGQLVVLAFFAFGVTLVVVPRIR